MDQLRVVCASAVLWHAPTRPTPSRASRETRETSSIALGNALRNLRHARLIWCVLPVSSFHCTSAALPPASTSSTSYLLAAGLPLRTWRVWFV